MLENTSDRHLLDLFRDPSMRQKGFAMLVNEYQQPVYWLIRRMVFNHDDANDIAQDTFVKIWQNLDGFREESKLYTWIYRIASNEALYFLKRKKLQSLVPFEKVQHKLRNQIVDDHYFKGDEIERKLHNAIGQLPPQQRLIFNMKYFNELKYEEIAAILNLTVGALKASYHHAVKKIEKIITAC